jgi:hypothetical protein
MLNRSMWKRVIALFLLCLVGCGDGNPFDYVPVSGRLTYEDGTPILRGGCVSALR